MKSFKQRALMTHSLACAVLIALGLMSVGCGTDRSAAPGGSEPVAAVHDDYELGLGMAWLQRWTSKLWYAGDNANWELADFYLHETEETLDEMMAAGVVKEGHDISALMQAMLLPQIEALETAVDGQDIDLFRQSYRAMVVSCNACHVATEHGFLVMDVPAGPAPFAQQFAP